MRPPVRGFGPQQPRGAADPSATRPAFTNNSGSEPNSPGAGSRPGHHRAAGRASDRGNNPEPGRAQPELQERWRGWCPNLSASLLPLGRARSRRAVGVGVPAGEMEATETGMATEGQMARDAECECLPYPHLELNNPRLQGEGFKRGRFEIDRRPRPAPPPAR